MKPTIDAIRIKSTYDTLSQMHLDLDNDPLRFGPKRLNSKVAQCRGLLTQCEKIFLQISQDLHWFKRDHRRVQTEFDVNMQELLANDPEVMAGRSLKDREAIAANKLSSLRDVANTLEAAIDDFDQLMIVIKAKRSDLRDVQGRIRDQLKICQEEIGLGARWGNQNTPSNDPSAPTENPENAGTMIDEFDKLLESVATAPEKNGTSNSPTLFEVDRALDMIPDDIFEFL